MSKSFGRANVWSDVTLTLPSGEVSVLLRPSGTGKSVFLKTLIGLLKPEQGSIVIHDTDLVRCSESRLYELRKLLDTSSEFTAAAQAALPQTTALLRDGRTVLTTQNQTAGQFQDFSSSLAQLADQLKTSDPDLRRLIRNAPGAGRQISGLLDESS